VTVALVTGAASGIGLALATELTRGGTLTVLADRDPRITEVAASLGPLARPASLDVTDSEAFDALARQTIEQHGGIDLLINNAGIGLTGAVRDMSLADWRRLVDVNVWGVVHGVHAVYPHMVERGSGAILNVASGAGLLPRPGMTAYAATKHAVVGLSTSLRAEASAHGVRVNVACPGYVATAIQDHAAFVNLDKAALLNEVPAWVVPMTAETCAQKILRGVARDRGVIPVSALTRLEHFFYRLFPRFGLLLAAWRGRRIAAHRLPGASCTV
jgi:NADP-dependent 3-hydroxy acid dehydrogenase YdfG